MDKVQSDRLSEQDGYGIEIPVAGKKTPTKPYLDTPAGRLMSRLKDYIDEREAKADYLNSFFGIPLGYSKQQKIAAAQALIDNIDQGIPVARKHLAALKNGELRQHFLSYVDIMQRDPTEDRRRRPKEALQTLPRA